MITLHGMSGSGFSWRVWLTLEHKGLEHRVLFLSPSAGDLKTDAFAALNPRRRVPVIDDDGFVLYESAAIVEYLEERFPAAPPLFPRDPQARARVRRVIREIDSYLAVAEEELIEEIFFVADPGARDRARIARARAAVLAELAHHEAALEGDFLLGALSAADFALYPIIALFARLELREPELGLLAARGPKLQAWCARIEALPYFERTYPPHWRPA